MNNLSAIRSFFHSALLLSIVLLMSGAVTAKLSAQDNGFYESYVIMNSGMGNTYYDAGASTVNLDFQGASLGSFDCSQELRIGGQGKIYKCYSADVTATRIYWRVWSGTPSGAFSAVNMSWLSNDPGALCAPGQNQTWEEANLALMPNVLSGLWPGSYTLEVYFEGNATGAGSVDPFYHSNGGANYQATFTIGGNWVLNTNSGEYFCSIQDASNDAQTLNGHTLSVYSGTYSGNLDLSAKSTTLSPGSSPGCVTNTGNLTLGSSNTLTMEVNGNTACTQYDQISVTGTVTLGGASLSLSVGYAMGVADQIVLIENDGTDAVTGQFAQGSSILVSGTLYRINYAGGTGNDVVLSLACGSNCGPLTYTGNYTFSTQAQLNAFKDPSGCKYTNITGNVVLDGNGNAGSGTDVAGADPITDLCNLQELTTIGGNLTIRDFIVVGNPTSLADLSNLTTIGGSLTIGSGANDNNSTFTEVKLNGVTDIGDANIISIRYNDIATSIELKNLSGQVGATVISFNSLVNTVDIGSLGSGWSIGGTNDLTLQNLLSLDALDLSKLSSTGGDIIFNFTTGALGSPDLTSINLASLATVGNGMTLDNNNLNPAGATINLASLVTVGSDGSGSMTLNDIATGTLDLRSLVTVNGSLSITNNDNGLQYILFRDLATVLTDLTVTGNNDLISIADEAAGPAFTIGQDLNVELNLSGVLASIDLQDLLSVTRDISFDENNTNPSGAAITLPALTSVGRNMVVTQIANSISAGAFQTLTGNMNISDNNSLCDLDMGGLQTVLGYILIDDNFDACGSSTIDFGSLTTVGDNLPLSTSDYLTIIDNDAMPSITFTSLTAVNGDGGGSSRSIEIINNDALVTIAFPLLTSVPGEIYIGNCDAMTTSTAAALTVVGEDLFFVGNPQLTTLSFPLLTTVTAAVDIDNNDALASLDASFPALTTIGTTLSITGNASLGECCIIPCQLSSINGISGPFSPAPNANPSGVTISSNKTYASGGRCINNGSTTSGFNVAKGYCTPSISSFTSTETSGTVNDDNEICAGATVTFDALATLGASGTLYYEFFIDNDGLGVGTETIMQAASLSTSATYSSFSNGDQVYVRAINTPTGCDVVSNAITITVNANPTASITSSLATFCNTNDIDLDGNPSGGTAPYSTHAWSQTGGSGSGSFDFTTNPNAVFTASTSGSVTLEYIVTDSKACQASDTETLNILLESSCIKNLDDNSYWPTLQSAIDNATASDELEIPAGTYSENIVVNKSLTFSNSGPVTIQGLEMNGAGITLILNNDFSVSNLTLTVGVINTQNNELFVPSGGITGGSASSYIIAPASLVITGVGPSTTVIAPIGTGLGYTPVTFATTGTHVSDDITFSVVDRASTSAFTGGPTYSRFVPFEWNISEATPIGSSAIITFEFPSDPDNIATGPVIGRYNGVSWVNTFATFAGSGPYTVTGNTAFTSFSPFGAFGSATCGSSCAGTQTYTGNITLDSQSDLNAFINAGCKYDAITGNITIVGNVGTDPIIDLCNLSDLTQVGGSMVIRDFNAIANPDNLNVLSLLQSIGTNLTIGGSAGDANPIFANPISFPALTTVSGSIDISFNQNATSVTLNALTSVTTDVRIDNNADLTNVSVGAAGLVIGRDFLVNANDAIALATVSSTVTSVGRNLTFDNDNTNLSGTAISLDDLTIVGANGPGSMTISDIASGTLDLTALETVNGNLTISNNKGGLTAISFEQIKDVDVDLDITQNEDLVSITDAAAGDPLIVGRDLTVTGNDALGLSSIDFQDLQTVGRDLIMDNDNSNPAGASISLPSLVSVAQNMTISDIATGTLDLTTLETVNGSLTISNNEGGLTAISFEQLKDVDVDLDITQNDDLVSISDAVAGDPLIVGRDVTVTGNGALALTSIDFQDLQSVGRDLIMDNNNTNPTGAAITLPALTSVGQNMVISQIANSISAGTLQTITGNLSISDNNSLCDLDMGDLQTVLGYFLISDNFDACGSSTIDFGSLATVGDNAPLATSDYLTLSNNIAMPSITFTSLTAVIGNGGGNNRSVEIINNDALATIAFPLLTGVPGELYIGNCAALTSASAATLATVGEDLYFVNNPLLTTLSFPLLTTVTAAMDIDNNDALASLDASFPALTTIGTTLSITGNASLGECCIIPCQLSSINGISGPFSPAPNANPSGVTISSNKTYASGGRCINNGSTTSGFNVAKGYCTPSISSFTSTETSGTVNDDNEICAGATVTFDALATLGASGTLYYEFFIDNDGLGVGTETIMQAASLSTSASYSNFANGDQVYVRAINTPTGCDVVSTAITITVNANPTASITSSLATFCNTNDIDLDGNPSGGTAPYSTHAWSQTGGSGSGSFDFTTNQTAEFTASASGTVTIQYIVADSKACSASDTEMLTILVESICIKNVDDNTYWPTLQSAIDNASASDELEIPVGTYLENVVVDKSLSFSNTGPVSIQGLQMNGMGITLTLDDDFSVTNLTLSDGIINTQNNELFVPVAGITGGSASSYIIAPASLVITGVGPSTTVIAPIGTGLGYTPVTFATTGTHVSDDITFSVVDRASTSAFTGGPTYSRFVPFEWNISEATPSGSSVIITLQFPSDPNNIAGSPVIGHYNGSSWVSTFATYAGSGPYTATGNTPFTSFSPFGAFGSATCGSSCAGTQTYTGNITLDSQSDLNAFMTGGCKYDDITGNITIVGNVGSDPIIDLCNLSDLTAVGGSMVIRDFNAVANPDNLNALSLLQSVGTNLTIGGSAGDANPIFTNPITFPALTTVSGSIDISFNQNATSVSLNALTSVTNDVRIDNNTDLTNVSVGAAGLVIGRDFLVSANDAIALATVSSTVTSVGRNLTFDNDNTNLSGTAISLDDLTIVGATGTGTMTISDIANGTLDLTTLETVNGNLHITNNEGGLTAISFEQLKEVDLDLDITQNDDLVSVTDGAAGDPLIVLRDVTVTGNDAIALGNIDLQDLQSVGRDLIMDNDNSNPAGASISLPSLVSVAQNMTIVQISSSVSITAAGLNVSGDFTINDNNSLCDLNLSGLTTVGGFFEITNNYDACGAQTVSIGSLQTVGEHIEVSGNDDMPALSFSTLTTVSGQDGAGRSIDITNNDNELSSLSFPALNSPTTGEFRVNGNAALASISAPLLPGVGEDLRLEDNNLVNTLAFNALASVAGLLNISNEDAVSDLNAFGSLTTVNNFTINSNNALTQFSSLTLLTATTGNLIISNNPALNNLAGLSNLLSIGGYFDFNNNDAITTLDGPTGFASLDYVGGTADVTGNALLTNCCVMPCRVEDPSNPGFTDGGGAINVSANNGPGLCTTLAEAETACTPSAGSITGVTEVCLNSSINLTGNPSGGNPPYSHAWTITGGTGSANITDPSVNPAQFTGLTAGTVDVEYIATSADGCSSPAATYTFTVNSLPTCAISGPDGPLCPNVTGNIYSAPGGLSGYSWTITGNGSITSGTTSETVTVSAGAGCNQSFTVTLVVTDANGCQSTCQKSVNVIDNTPPSLIGPACSSLDVTGQNKCLTQADAFDGNSLTSSVQALYTDLCGSVTASYTGKTPGGSNSDCSWSFTYHFNIEDDCNNSLTCDVTHSGGDTEDPALIDPQVTCASLNTANHNECLSAATSWDATQIEASVAALYDDNCDASVTATLINTVAGSNNSDCNWIFTYTYQIEDNCNNSVTCDVTRSGGDTEDPALIDPQVTCASLNTANHNECLSAATSWDATQIEASVAALYDDNCDASVTATLINTVAGSNNSDCNWIFTYTYQIEDNCNNSVTCDVTRSGGDTEDPALIDPQVTCASLNTANHNECLSAATSWDATQIEASVAALYDDNCDASVTATLINTVAGSNNSDCNWIFTYTYQIEDNCNNSVTCDVTRSGGDTEDPALIDPQVTCASLNTANHNECLSAATSWDATQIEASVAALYDDNCDASVTATLINTVAGSNNSDCNWIFTYTYQIEDNCNNSVTCDVTRSGGDTEDPALIDPQVTCASLNTANHNECLSAASSWDATQIEASVAALYDDNCDASVTATLINTVAGSNNGDCNWIFTYTYQIEDNCNNSVTCDVTRSGGDTEDPALIDPQVTCASLNTANHNECLSAATSWDATQIEASVAALYDDNCDTIVIATLISTVAGSNNSDCNWIFTYTYQIEDNCNNSVTCDVTRSGGDTEDPALIDPQVTCASLNTANHNECLSAATSWDATQIEASVAALYDDNCDASVTATLINTVAGSNNSDCNWIFTYTYQIEDNCNNSVTCDVTRSGSDQDDPTPVTQNITIYLDPQGQASITEDAVNNQSYDDCQGQPTFDTDITSFNCSDVGANTVTLTVYDACMNSASATATVTVVDNTLPTITCVGNQTRNTNNGICTYTTVSTEFDPTIWDNCGYSVVNNYNNTSTLAGAVFNKGLTTVVWTITDASSNSATCSFTLTVVDNQAPNAICKTATISLNANGIAVLSPSLINNGSTDNCAVTGVAAIPNTFDCSDLGFNTVMLMVFDQAGNVGTCNTVVLVQDIIPPTPICKNITVQLDQQGFVGITGAMVDNGSYDNCSVTNLAVSPNSFTCANTGANTVILTVTDQSGNTATCIATVTVVDNILPTISCVGNQNRNTDPAVCTYTAVGTEFDPTYGDNCPNPVVTWTATGATPAAGTGSMAGTVFPKGTTTVVMTVTDASNNTSTCSFTVTVSDNQAPIISLPQAVLTMECFNSQVVDAWTATATANDNCDGTVSVTASYQAPATNCNQVVTVSFTASDIAGNVATSTATFTVDDQTPPVYASIQPFTASCSSVSLQNDLGLWLASVSATDNCGLAVNISNDFANLTLPVTGCGSITVTFTATDQCQNVSTATSTITLTDTQAPVFATIQPFTSSCSSTSLQNDLGLWLASVSASDNCGQVSISNDFANLTLPVTGCGTITVTFTATDQCQNVSTAISTITLTDTQAPVFAQIHPFSSSCSATTLQGDIAAWLASASATDNCGQVTITNDFANLTLPASGCGSITVTFTATDQCQNVSTATSTITLTDTQAPVYASIQPFTASCSSVSLQNDLGLWLASVNATDNCGQVTITNDFSNLTLPASGCGTITVTFTATDQCQNISTATSTITLTDTQAPVFTTIQPFTASCNSVSLQNDLGLWLASVSATDNCGQVTITNDFANLTLPASGCGTITVTFTATDQCQNVSTATSTITLTDTQAPLFATIQPFTSSCSSVSLQNDLGLWLASVSATDNCGQVSISNDFANLTLPASGCGTITVTFTATDQCQNISTAISTITLIDTQAPLFATIQPFTASCSSVSLQNDLGLWLASVNATDNCGQVTITNDYANLTLPASGCGTITVTFTATDQCQNVSTATSTITLTDTQAPVFATIQPFTASCSSVSLQNDLGLWLASVNASDNCGQVSISNDFANLTLPVTGCGTITVTFTATDQCQNISTATSTITLTDTQGPVFTTIQPFTASCNSVSLQNDLGLWLAAVGATDNCGQVTITNDFANLTLPASGCGTITVTFTATDQCQNISTATSTITLTDTQTPVFAAIQPFTASCSSVSLQNDLGLWLASVSATDNCGQVTITNDFANLTLPASGCGTFTVTFTATDQCQNISTATSTITLTDTQAPLFATIQPFTASCSSVSLQNDLGLWLASVSATDNCGQVTVTNNFSTLTLPANGCGTITVTFTATDQCQNISTATSSITLTDTQAPLFATIQPFTASCSSVSLQNDLGLWLASVSATDNCGQVTISNDFANLTLPTSGCGTITVTFTATDQCQNISTATSTITLTDTQAPVLACPTSPQSRTIFYPVISYTTLGNEFDPTVSDNCGSVSLSNNINNQASLAGHVFPVGQTTVIWTAVDQCNNISTCTVVVNVIQSNMPPVISCPANITVNANSTSCNAQVTSGLAPTYSDPDNNIVSVTWMMFGATAGASPSTGINILSSHTFNVGTTNILYTVKDAAGLSAACLFTVKVKDVTPPTIACPGNQILTLSYNCRATIPTYIPGAVVSDNCSGVSVFQTPSSGSIAMGAGTFTVVLTAVDAAGNSATCSFTVTKVDVTPPVITACPPNQSINLNAGCQITVPNLTANMNGSDNCGTVSFTQVPAAGTIIASGHNQTLTVVITANDGNGNTAQCHVILTAKDVTAPNLQIAGNVTLGTSADGLGNCNVLYAVPDAQISDNCGNLTLSWQISGALTLNGTGQIGSMVFPVGQCTIIYTLSDGAFTVNSSMTITVVDDEVPVVTLLGNATETLCVGSTYTEASAVAQDNCGGNMGMVQGQGFVNTTIPGVYTLTYSVVDAAGNVSIPAIRTVDVIDCGVSVSGTFRYNNQEQTPLDNVSVDLVQNDQVIYSAITNSSGEYSFPLVQPGTYEVLANVSSNTTGALNSLDAGMVNAWGITPYAIEKVRFRAADGLYDDYLDAGDAVRINQYYVQQGNPDWTQPLTKWTFWRANESISSNPFTESLYPEIVVGGTPLTQDFYGLVTGDFNGSFVPGPAKGIGSVQISNGQKMPVAPGSVVDMPVKAEQAMTVGAISLTMNYPADKAEVLGVYLHGNSNISIPYVADNGTLRIGWFGNAGSLAAGQVLFSIQMKLSDDLNTGDLVRIEAAEDPLNELGNATLNVIGNAVLSAPDLQVTTTGLDANKQGLSVDVSCYPNPFRGIATIEYSLPAEGRVLVEVYDLLGQRIYILNDTEMPAGTHTMDFDAGSWSTGVYLLRVEFRSDDAVLMKSIRINKAN
jgi:hypothetical protein